MVSTPVSVNVGSVVVPTCSKGMSSRVVRNTFHCTASPGSAQLSVTLLRSIAAVSMPVGAAGFATSGSTTDAATRSLGFDTRVPFTVATA